MKQFLLLLFIGALFLNKNAAAQEPAATEAKIDTVEEDWGKNYKREQFDGFFPGGDTAWQNYLEKNLVYPKKAKRKMIEGTVTVQFILDKWGTVTEVKALSGPEELRNSAVDVVMRSPKWFPAIQGGRQVKAYKKRDIVFKLKKQ